jgi:hypothetical protein
MSEEVDGADASGGTAPRKRGASSHYCGARQPSENSYFKFNLKLKLNRGAVRICVPPGRLFSVSFY